MKNIKYFTCFLATIIVLFMITGCTLPSLNINNSATSTSASNLTPTQSIPTTTPTPINPSFSSLSLPVENQSLQLPDLASVIAAVKPSVVAINTKIPGVNIFGGDLTQEGAGSGWIIDSNGLIVTNNHVVEGANSITVTLEDGRSFSADKVSTDPVSDLATIRINASNLPSSLKIGDSSRLRSW